MAQGLCGRRRSAETGKPVKLNLAKKKARPNLKQEIRLPRVRKVKHVHAVAPSRD
jgi:hypothetical protein